MLILFPFVVVVVVVVVVCLFVIYVWHPRFPLNRIRSTSFHLTLTWFGIVRLPGKSKPLAGTPLFYSVHSSWSLIIEVFVAEASI